MNLTPIAHRQVAVIEDGSQPLAKLGAGHFTVPSSERIEQLCQPPRHEECSVLRGVPQGISDQRRVFTRFDQVRDRSLDCHSRQPVEVRYIGCAEIPHP